MTGVYVAANNFSSHQMDDNTSNRVYDTKHIKKRLQLTHTAQKTPSVTCGHSLSNKSVDVSSSTPNLALPMTN